MRVEEATMRTTADLKPVDLDALEKLHAASTQGEWRVNYLSNKWILLPTNTEGDDNRIDNAEFVAAAHNALPALIAELRELRELVGRKVVTKIICRIDVGSRLGWGVFRFRETKREVRIYEPAGLSSSDLDPLLNFCINSNAAARKWEPETEKWWRDQIKNGILPPRRA